MNSTKYILIECDKNYCTGWADRIKGILSAYGLSLVTNRQLVINIKKPCSLTNYLEPNEVNWNITLPKNLTFVKYEHHNNITNILNNTASVDKDKDVLVLNFLFDYIWSLGRIPEFQEKLQMLGYEKYNVQSVFVFDKWYRKLFKFNKNLEIDYKKYLNQLRPTLNHKIICVQIRIGGYQIRNGTRFYDSFFMHRNETYNYWKFIKENLIFNKTSNKTLQDYRIFLTTDTADVVEEAAQVFGNEKVVGSNDKITNIAHYNNNRDSNQNCPNFRYVFIDFFLLSQCDMGVISYSGFGHYGLMNRQNKNYDGFYVYSRPSYSNNSVRFFRKF